MAMNELRVKIQLPRDATMKVAAAVHVVIEDVSVVDAPARVLSERRKANVHVAPNELIDFVVPYDEKDVDPRASYSVRVHVSVSGKDQIRAGDYVSPHFQPVVTYGSPDCVLVLTRRVG